MCNSNRRDAARPVLFTGMSFGARGGVYVELRFIPCKLQATNCLYTARASYSYIPGARQDSGTYVYTSITIYMVFPYLHLLTKSSSPKKIKFTIHTADIDETGIGPP